MSSDDVQNARYIRQVFNNRTSKITYGQRMFSVGNTILSRSGVFGSTLLFSQMTLNRRSVSSLGNASSETIPWYKKVGNFFQSGVASISKTIGEFGTKAWNGASNFFSNAGKWGEERLNDIKDWGKSVKDYVWKSVTKFVLGDYSDDNITVLSFVGNIITGFFDVDLPLDARDLVYDVQHWGEGENFGIYFALDVVALIPIIGVVKYCKYADDIADGAKDLGKVIEAGGDVGKTIDNITDTVDDAKDFGKAVDTTTDAGKAADNVNDASKDLGKVADVAEEASDYSKNISFNDTCFDHVVKGNGIKSKNISGAHNLEAFEKTITDAGGNLDECIISKVKHPTIDGINEITYKVPGSDVLKTKTVYDPSVISDQQILKWGEEAFNSSGRIVKGGVIYGVAPNGLAFEGYIDEETGIIRAFFPKLD